MWRPLPEKKNGLPLWQFIPFLFLRVTKNKKVTFRDIKEVDVSINICGSSIFVWMPTCDQPPSLHLQSGPGHKRLSEVLRRKIITGMNILYVILHTQGHAVTYLVDALCYKLEGHRFESRMRFS
jgi:hypothetical protein